MVNKMIKRSKKGFPIAKLSTSNETITKFKGKCRDIWSFIKKVWYVPFIWSLAWFSYWMFYGAIVFNQALTHGDPLNYLGAAISIAALLIAGYVSRKSKEKLVSLGKAPEREKIHAPPLPQKPMQKIKIEKTEHVEPKTKDQSLIEMNPLQESSEMPQKPPPPPSTTSAFHNRIYQTTQAPKSQVIASECLTCPNLVDCKHRQNRTNESGPCPFAK